MQTIRCLFVLVKQIKEQKNNGTRWWRRRLDEGVGSHALADVQPCNFSSPHPHKTSDHSSYPPLPPFKLLNSRGQNDASVITDHIRSSQDLSHQWTCHDDAPTLGSLRGVNIMARMSGRSSGVGKWVVFHVITYITGMETKPHTRAEHGCLVAGQSPLAAGLASRLIGCTPALSLPQQRRCSCSCRLWRYISAFILFIFTCFLSFTEQKLQHIQQEGWICMQGQQLPRNVRNIKNRVFVCHFASNVKFVNFYDWFKLWSMII